MDNNRLMILDKEHHEINPSHVHKTHLFMIGIDKYQNGITPLKNAVKDVDAIFKILQEKYLMDGRHTILRDDKATRANIYRTFYDYLAMLEEGDNLIIYYAGHSNIDKKYKDAFWYPYDAVKGEYHTYIDTEFIQRKLKQIKARHILLISDSCYSYGLFYEAGSRNGINKAFGNEKNRSRYGFYSGRAEVSDGIIHSPFARVLLDYLEESDIDFYTVEMYVYMLKKMWTQGVEDQEAKYEVIPGTFNEGGEFVFRLRKSNEEAHFWRKILENPTLESCKNYLERYGEKGKYAEKVQGEIYKILDRDKVNEIWNTTLRENRIESYEAFINLYSYHSLSEEARKKITLIRRKEKKRQDTLDWEDALLLASHHSFEEYLVKQPNGKYVKKAKEIINSLKQKKENNTDFTESIELFEYYSNQNGIKYVNEKLERNRLGGDFKDTYEKFYCIAQEFIKKYPDIVLYSLMCESMIKDFTKERGIEHLHLRQFVLSETQNLDTQHEQT